jgi:hypothetical protein
MQPLKRLRRDGRYFQQCHERMNCCANPKELDGGQPGLLCCKLKMKFRTGKVVNVYYLLKGAKSRNFSEGDSLTNIEITDAILAFRVSNYK